MRSNDVGGQVVDGTGWKMIDGGLGGKCSKTQGRSSRLDCTPRKRSNDDHGAAEMGGRGSDDIGAAVLREE